MARPGQDLTSQQIAEVLAPLHLDYVDAMRTYVRSMFIPASPARLTEAIVTAMSEMPPQIGVDVGEQVLAYDRMMLERLQEVQAPNLDFPYAGAPRKL